MYNAIVLFYILHKIYAVENCLLAIFLPGFIRKYRLCNLTLPFFLFSLFGCRIHRSSLVGAMTEYATHVTLNCSAVTVVQYVPLYIHSFNHIHIYSHSQSHSYISTPVTVTFKLYVHLQLQSSNQSATLRPVYYILLFRLYSVHHVCSLFSHMI